MAFQFRIQPAHRWRWALGTMVVLAACFAGLKIVAVPKYHRWLAAHYFQDAQAQLKAGDAPKAMTTLRRALVYNSMNSDGWRLAVEIANVRKLPEAVIYQQNVTRLEPTADNYLELLRLALRYNQYQTAVDTLANGAAVAKGRPEYHRLAVSVYRQMGNLSPIKFHLLSLLQLKPEDRTARLDLTEIEVREDVQGAQPQLRETLQEYTADPIFSERALGALLRDAVTRKKTDNAAELTKRLLLLDTISAANRILCLEAMYSYDTAQAEAYGMSLRKAFVSSPADTSALLDFFTKSGRTALAKAYYSFLPKELRDDERVVVSASEALLAAGDWKELEAVLEAQKWKEHEYYRHAMLAYIYRAQHRAAEFADAWQVASIQASSDPRYLADLLNRVEQWKWTTEKYDIVWRLFTIMPTNAAVRSSLENWSVANGATADLNRVYSRLLEVGITDQTTRNNFAYTSLLLNSNLPNALVVADGLVKESPTDPFFLTTQALGLYRQNKSKEALALLETLKPSELEDPVRMMYHGIYLVSAGQYERGKELLISVPLSHRLLPEEALLLQTTQGEVTKWEEDRSRHEALASLSPSQKNGNDGWLAALPEAIQGKATADMRVADSFYAAKDFAALKSATSSNAQWKDFEYIKAAISSYATKALGETTKSAADWNQALALAGRRSEPLQHLRLLSIRWSWSAQRADVERKLFDLNQNDPELLKSLNDYYRVKKSTSDLASLYRAYLHSHPEDKLSAIKFSYYSLLCDQNSSEAHVAARNVFDSSASLPDAKAVYAFSLWKQKRFAEALQLLEQVSGNTSDVISIPLLKSAILTDSGKTEQAAEELKGFNGSDKLPEEVGLATQVSSNLKTRRPAN